MTADPDLTTAAAALTAIAHAIEDDSAVEADRLLDALILLRWTQSELTALEPALIAAARAAGVSWQTLAPALGVASRQAAERRYLRSTSTAPGHPEATRDQRVQAERDRRAGDRAVTRWANDNTADLRRLAGQITALTDLDASAAESIGRLHDALGDADAEALPGLLAATRPHLPRHPGLAAEINAVTAQTDHLREEPARWRHDSSNDR